MTETRPLTDTHCARRAAEAARPSYGKPCRCPGAVAAASEAQVRPLLEHVRQLVDPEAKFTDVRKGTVEVTDLVTGRVRFDAVRGEAGGVRVGPWEETLALAEDWSGTSVRLAGIYG